MKAAVVGAGVIGGGWAARFLLHGWTVAVFDPSAAARAGLEATLTAARRSLPKLYDAPLPEEGRLITAPDLETAIADADWIQESVSEDLELKRQVHAAVAQDSRPDTPIASSTSGFRPSVLAADMAHAPRLLVCHPFNPVYLLPLVEVVPSERTSPEIVIRAMLLLEALGMKPVRIRLEIDAHVADRLLEAMWREALWLVRDGIATTEEIDTVIRCGFGPRWAQMGMFETYRIAGGDAGMRHFLAQFGPRPQVALEPSHRRAGADWRADGGDCQAVRRAGAGRIGPRTRTTAGRQSGGDVPSPQDERSRRGRSAQRR